MRVKATVRYPCVPTRTAEVRKTDDPTCGESVEQLEPLYAAGESADRKTVW